MNYSACVICSSDYWIHWPARNPRRGSINFVVIFGVTWCPIRHGQIVVRLDKRFCEKSDKMFFSVLTHGPACETLGDQSGSAASTFRYLSRSMSPLPLTLRTGSTGRSLSSTEKVPIKHWDERQYFCSLLSCWLFVPNFNHNLYDSSN